MIPLVFTLLSLLASADIAYVHVVGDQNTAYNNDDFVLLGDGGTVANTSDTQVLGEDNSVSNSHDSTVIGRANQISDSTRTVIVGTDSHVSSGLHVTLLGSQLSSENESEIVILGANNAPAAGASCIVGSGNTTHPKNAIEVFPDRVLLEGIHVTHTLREFQEQLTRLRAELTALSLATSGTCECSVIKDAYLGLGCCPSK